MVLTLALAAAGQLGQQPSAPIIGIPLDVTFPSSYTAGGEAFDADALVRTYGNYDKLPANVAVLAEPRNGFVFEYDRTNKKLKALTSGVQNIALGPAGLVIGTGSTAKVKVANTVAYLSGGLFKSKTTAEVAFTPTTDDITASASAIKERVYLVTVDSGGTLAMTAGDVATGAGLAKVPAAPNGKTVLGYVRVAVAAGATPFDASTDALSAGHLTVTYVDTGVSPAAGMVEVNNAADLSAVVARVTLITK